MVQASGPTNKNQLAREMVFPQPFLLFVQRNAASQIELKSLLHFADAASHSDLKRDLPTSKSRNKKVFVQRLYVRS